MDNSQDNSSPNNVNINSSSLPNNNPVASPQVFANQSEPNSQQPTNNWTSSQPTPTTPNKKPSKRKLAILITSILVLVIAAVTAFIFLSDKDTSPASQQNSDNNSKINPSYTAESIIKSLHDKANQLLTDQTTIEVSTDQSSNSSFGTVLYKLPEVDFIVETDISDKGAFYSEIRAKDSGPGAYSDMVDAMRDINLELVDYAKNELNMEEVDIFENAPIAVEPDNKVTVLKKDNIICNIPIVGQEAIQATCVEESKIQEATDQVKPYVSIIKENHPSAAYIMSYALVSISDGKNGYKITVVSGDEVPINLVQAPGQSTWKYAGVLQYQDISECSKYEADIDISRAFEGSTCYRDIVNQSTVKAQ